MLKVNIDATVLSSRAPSRLVLGSLYGITWVVCLLLWACNFCCHWAQLKLKPKQWMWPSLLRRTSAYGRSLLSQIVQFLLELSRTHQKYPSVLKISSRVSKTSYSTSGNQMLHVRRQGNTPAHHLARHAKGLDNFVICIEETLNFY